jgi:hypothetical protein
MPTFFQWRIPSYAQPTLADPRYAIEAQLPFDPWEALRPTASGEMSPVRTLEASHPALWGPGLPSGAVVCVCAFQKTTATMDLCGVGWECGEEASGDPATGNAREDAPWYDVWTSGHDYGGISNF